MTEMKERIHENGLDYKLVDDYYVPDLKLPEETRPIGIWGRIHREYLKENNPLLFNHLVLTGGIWTYLANLNEQAQKRYDLLIQQHMLAQGIDENLKSRDQMAWVGAMNNIASSARETVLTELIYC